MDVAQPVECQVEGEASVRRPLPAFFELSARASACSANSCTSIRLHIYICFDSRSTTSCPLLSYQYSSVAERTGSRVQTIRSYSCLASLSLSFPSTGAQRGPRVLLRVNEIMHMKHRAQSSHVISASQSEAQAPTYKPDTDAISLLREVNQGGIADVYTHLWAPHSRSLASERHSQKFKSK